MSNSQPPDPRSQRTLRSSVRNPRRRQRQSGDSDSIRAPRRKRSKLNEDTFTPRPSAETTDEVVMNGTIDTGRQRKASFTPSVDMELTVRGSKKGTLKRGMKGDGAKVLTQNKTYSVKLLPSTPKQLEREGLEYRGSLGAGHLALAVTREHAYIWDYTAHTQVNNARVFDVPFATKDGDSLPFGALVTSGASPDVGLLLVSATNGKVVYYESIERATSLGLFQERQSGVESSLGSLFSGETVTDLVSADHAGFILTLSSGRLLQLHLRDAQGKARVSTQFLRASEPSASGVLGSIRGFIGVGAWKRDLVAVHTRALGIRGQMQVVSLTERGEVQLWDVEWSGRYDFKRTIAIREMLVRELKTLEPAETQGRVDSIVALDFVIVEKPTNTRGDEIATVGAQESLDIWLLLRIGTVDTHSYTLAEMSLAHDGLNITRVIPLESYHGADGRSSQWRPRLVLPKPWHTAFVVFSDAVVLVSTTDSEPDPDAQLRNASYIEAGIFEDPVLLRSDKGLAVLGAMEEESKAGHASTLAFVKGAGLVRFSAVDPAGDVERSRISARSKIEQAVFYGALQDSILDFSRKGESVYSVEEVEEATLAISDEVLCSDTAFISTSPTSIESHLAYKAEALRALVTFVRRNYPTLSRASTWQLLWDAEKIAAAKQMWTIFEEYSVSDRGDRKRKATIFDELCPLVQAEYRLASPDGTDDDDPVRRFFVRGLSHVDYFLPKVRTLLEQIRVPQDEPVSPDRVLRLVTEADAVWINTLEAVFAFRSENAATYGVAAGFIEEGVLTDPAELAELPEFWTSSVPMLKAVVPITSESREFAKEFFEQNNEAEPADLIPYIEKIRSSNPRLVQLCCFLYQERINWLKSRTSFKDQELARKLEINYEATRYQQFRDLQDIADAPAAMKLAEKYGDMHTLTEIVVAESQYAMEAVNDPQNADEKASALELVAGYIKRIGRYFEKFGDAWANAFFDEAFSGSRAGAMLEEAQENWRDHLTRYLRAKPSRAKICWINDVTAEKDFGHAAAVLTDAATNKETRLWAKKVELSMSKLALTAAQESSPASKADVKTRLGKLERELELLDVQQRLYQHILPEVISCIDRQAELEMAIKKFGKRNPDLPSLKQLLQNGLYLLLDHNALSVEDLIDILTLIDVVVPPDGEDPEGNLQGEEFYLALRALNAAAPSMPQTLFETLLQLIWKRCYVYDDWVEINKMSASKKKTMDGMWVALRNTATWRTYYVLYNSTLLDQADCYIRVLIPSECLGAACKPEELKYRFEDHELLDPILHDNKIQDELLQSYVADRRLEEWVKDCEGDVKKTIEEEAEERARRLAREREVEGVETGNGIHSDKANGYVNGVLHNGEAAGHGGDVEMA